jgi:hypothetical protein
VLHSFGDPGTCGVEMEGVRFADSSLGLSSGVIEAVLLAGCWVRRSDKAPGRVGVALCACCDAAREPAVALGGFIPAHAENISANPINNKYR